jgi:glutamyl/glutaminyl-tRNA synthetase
MSKLIHIVRDCNHDEDLKAFTSYQAAVQFAIDNGKAYEETLSEEERQKWRQSIREGENDFFHITTIKLETGA